jgi:hypothetical protein
MGPCHSPTTTNNYSSWVGSGVATKGQAATAITGVTTTKDAKDKDKDAQPRQDPNCESTMRIIWIRVLWYARPLRTKKRKNTIRKAAAMNVANKATSHETALTARIDSSSSHTLAPTKSRRPQPTSSSLTTMMGRPPIHPRPYWSPHKSSNSPKRNVMNSWTT